MTSVEDLDFEGTEVRGDDIEVAEVEVRRWP
jgi:hypothetical protein